jgi:hypothetical protein
MFHRQHSNLILLQNPEGQRGMTEGPAVANDELQTIVQLSSREFLCTLLQMLRDALPRLNK